MELISSNLPASANVYLTSDYHIGSLNHSRSSMAKLIDMIEADPIGYMCNLGDSIEAILPNDKRFSSCAVDWQRKLVVPEQQAELLINLFTPIKDKILVWMLGNHEHKLLNSWNPAKRIAEGLGAPYGSAVCKLTMNFVDYMPIKFFLAHGSGILRSNAKDSIQRTANQKAALKMKLQRLAGDCIGMFVGHGHQLITVESTAEDELYLTDDGRRIHQHYRAGQDQSAHYIPPDSRWYGMTGSFLRLFSPPGSEAVGYGEMALFAPAEIGCLMAQIRNGKLEKLEKIVL